MNIFILDLDLEKCATYHVNKHVVKMCVEYAQLLCNAHHISGSESSIPYKLTHKNHPCSVWVRECIENYKWLCDLALFLCKEYRIRYDKIHKSEAVIKWAKKNQPNLKSLKSLTKFAIAMPAECQLDTAVNSYRNYYIQEKKHIAEWRRRSVPEWFEI